jgi:hypothetical protein
MTAGARTASATSSVVADARPIAIFPGGRRPATPTREKQYSYAATLRINCDVPTTAAAFTEP